MNGKHFDIKDLKREYDKGAIAELERLINLFSKGKLILGSEYQEEIEGRLKELGGKHEDEFG